jgi:succinoglycan biosynthesis transport protein ExoP
VELKDYLRLLRQSWRLVTACALIALAAATAVSLATKPVYQSDAKFFIRAANADGSVGNAYTGSLFTQQRVKSYKEFITSPKVTQAVVDRLQMPGLTAASVASKLSADANLDTVNLNVHGKDGDPLRAQRITQTAAEVFRDYVGKLEAPTGSVSPVALEIVLPAGIGHQTAPRTKLNLVLGLLVGLALGVGLAVLREVLDTRVKSPADMDERFKLATLAVVGFDAGAKAQPLIVHDDPRSPRAEAFRRLRTNLQFVDVDHQPQSIVVTSAVEGEGKTTTACNLAIALAAAGVEVILVDGDLRRPSVANYLGIEQAIGLTNVLIGQVGIEDALQDWGPTGRMRVLPSGTLPPNPSELLSSQHLRELIEDLQTEALVIIDAPPLLPVTDGAILSTVTSGTLFVVRLGKTRREQISNAVEAIRGLGSHVYGAVLNMAPTRGAEAQNYGYGTYGTYVRDLPEIFVPPRTEPHREAERVDVPAAPVSLPVSAPVSAPVGATVLPGLAPVLTAERPPPAAAPPAVPMAARPPVTPPPSFFPPSSPPQEAPAASPPPAAWPAQP